MSTLLWSYISYWVTDTVLMAQPMAGCTMSQFPKKRVCKICLLDHRTNRLTKWQLSGVDCKPVFYRIVHTWVTFEETCQPVVTGAAVPVRTVVTMIQTKQFASAVSYIDVSQLEASGLHVLC